MLLRSVCTEFQVSTVFRLVRGSDTNKQKHPPQTLRWMDDIPTMETKTGRALMKPPASKVTAFVLTGAADALGNHILFFPGMLIINRERDTRSDFHALNAATRTVLISITYQFQRAGSVARRYTVRTSTSYIQVGLTNSADPCVIPLDLLVKSDLIVSSCSFGSQ